MNTASQKLRTGVFNREQSQFIFVYLLMTVSVHARHSSQVNPKSFRSHLLKYRSLSLIVVPNQSSSPCLPSHPAYPPRPPSYILPLPQQLHTPPLPRQLLIPRHSMYKPMTSTTQPRHLVQFPFLMPPSLDDFCVRRSRNEVVICQGDPVPIADLAAGSAGARVDGRRRCGGGDVSVEGWGEEGCKGGGVVRGEEGVCL